MTRFFTIKYFVLLGFLLRLVFAFLIAPYYFHSNEYWVSGDTALWTTAFTNLLEHGIFSTALDMEYGVVGRLPGYSFILGPIYYLCGKDLMLAAKILCSIQILLDTACIYFVYKIILNLNFTKPQALIAAFAYTFYPFSIVWVPVAHSETVSGFFMFLGLLFITRPNTTIAVSFFGGLSIGASILTRPQVLPLGGLIGLMLLVNIYFFRKYIKKELLVFTAYSLGIFLSYGIWPIRNIVNHGKLELAQDIRGLPMWTEDMVAFRRFIYSVKDDWNPQFTDMLQNKKIKFPLKNMTIEDEAKLDQAVFMAQNCSETFSRWYMPGKVIGRKSHQEDTCRYKIAAIFDELREKQIKANPLDFYLFIPLKNLNKCLFKGSLYKDVKRLDMSQRVLFIFRTLLILLGLFFYCNSFLYGNHINQWFWLFFIYFWCLYLILSFGTSLQTRNIEMRYLLPGDVLLLFPAAIFVSQLTDFIKQRR